MLIEISATHNLPNFEEKKPYYNILYKEPSTSVVYDVKKKVIGSTFWQVYKKIKLPDGSFFVGVVGGVVDWIFKKKNILSITISAANYLNNLNNDKISKIVWEDVKKVFNLDAVKKPKYKIIREKMATFVQSPEEIFRKPKMYTKYKNVFLAGDWIDTGLPATIEGAITSGYNVANYINKI